MNPVLETIWSRASVRAFEERPLEAEHERAILDAALRAPTAGNMQLYTILTIHSQQVKDKLAETCDHQPFIAKAPLALIFLADMQFWCDLYAAAGIHGVTPGLSDLLLCAQDAMAAAQNAVIAAQSLGVGSCYIGDVLEQAETHRALFRLPAHVMPLSMLVLGYPKAGKMPPPRPRFDRDAIVQGETYRRLGPEELLSLVAKRQQADPIPYVTAFYRRKTGAQFSKEMERSARVLVDAFTSNTEA